MKLKQLLELLGGPRRKRIVNREVQYRVIAIVAASGLSISIGTFISLKILSYEIFSFLEIGNVNSDVSVVIMDSINHMSMYFLFFVCLSVFLAFNAAVYLSNRIAGPIFNINRVLERYLKGEKDVEIQIRDNDYFAELVEKLNQVLKEKKSGPPE